MILAAAAVLGAVVLATLPAFIIGRALGALAGWAYRRHARAPPGPPPDKPPRT